jgi:hypothetical protein
VERRDPITEVVVRRGDVELARWTVDCDGQPDLGTVDDLARLQLAARRLGWSVRLGGAAAAMCELLELAGLTEVLGEPECGEEVGVEEVVVTDDPVA